LKFRVFFKLFLAILVVKEFQQIAIHSPYLTLNFIILFEFKEVLIKVVVFALKFFFEKVLEASVDVVDYTVGLSLVDVVDYTVGLSFVFLDISFLAMGNSSRI
jgi:hypothetical protein